MFKKRITSITVLVLTFCSLSLFAQEDDLGTEVVNIVKPYTPTISDAFKVKETPVINDSISTTKKEVNYSIFSVPVASTFTPAKGKAATVEKAKPIKLYDNYATLGFGNYTSILGELYSNFQLSRTDNAGFFFRHNSSQGGIDGVRVDDKFYDTRLDGNYTSRQKEASYRLDAGVEHQLFNWYGLNDIYDTALDEEIDSFDVQHSYFSGYVGGSISVEDSFFDKIAANLRYLGDSYSSSEFNVSLQPEFSFPVSELTLKIDGDIDYLSGSFDRSYFNTEAINYSYLNAGITPALVYINNDLTFSLGAAAYVGLDTERSNTEFYIYPKINVSYRLVDELLIVYGGADGGLDQNAYYNFKEENPYISPTLFVMPTSRLYEGFAGLKGKLSNAIGYNVRASYGKDENRALFKSNPYFVNLPEREGYQLGNSFNVVYDDVNMLSVFGELKVEMSDVFSLGVNATYYSYDTTFEESAWNLPELKATIFSNFNITEQLYGGVSLFYVGEREDEVQYLGGIIDNVEAVTLDGYVDINLHFGYRLSDRLSIFAKGSNLLSDNYEKWNNYPVQGIQALLGATYKFDW